MLSTETNFLFLIETQKTEENVVNGVSEDGEDDKKEEQEVVFIQDLGFTVKIVSPGTEPFDIQVRSF